MFARPVAAAVVAAISTVMGLAAGLFGAFWLAVAAGTVACLDPVGGFFGILGLLGVASIGYGASALVAAIGLVRGRAWAWIASFHVLIIAVAGSLVASVTAGPQTLVLIGAALPVIAMAALFAPSLRPGTPATA